MVLSKEQAVEIKKQIIAQVDGSNVENKNEIKKSISEMNEKELEGFLKANNIPVEGVEGGPKGGREISGGSPGGGCIFCSIVKGEVPSYKIDESNKAIAILELNPFSKGHSIVIPLEHVEVDKLPKSAMTLVQKIVKKIKKKLKPVDVKIESSSFQGHAMINIIPIYEGQNLEKKKADEKELKALQKKLEVKKRSPRKKKVVVSKEIVKENLSKLPVVKFRIP